MGHAVKFSGIVTLLLDVIDQPLISLLRDRWLPRHSSHIVTLRAADDGLGVIVGQVDDPVFDADRPNELHAPDGVGLTFLDESPQRAGFERPLKTALVETESRFDGAVFGQLV